MSIEPEARPMECKKRRALTPLIAEVILIAVTLIAAMALAGFVFGLMGTYTSTAQVSASVVSCTGAAINVVCDVSLLNTGSANTAVTTSCAEKYGAVSLSGTVARVSGGTGSGLTIPAGGAALVVSCTPGTATSTSVDSPVVGSIAPTNGGSASFAGTVQT